VQEGAARVLSAGGPGTRHGRRLLDCFDRRLTGARLSPGGCADLLGAALFLDSLDLAEA
jgi:triphosphoribosyl-dephospho-CoA synthase